MKVLVNSADISSGTHIQQLYISLSGNVTTNQLPCRAHYKDVAPITSPYIKDDSNEVLTNNSTKVLLADFPASGWKREISQMDVFNADTVNATVTLWSYDGTNYYAIVQITLQPNYTWHFSTSSGWKITDTNGNTTTFDMAGTINNATADATPNAASKIGFWDSVANALRSMTITNLITFLESTFDTRYGTSNVTSVTGTAPIASSGSTTPTISIVPGNATAKASPVVGDGVLIGDSAAGGAAKISTITQIFSLLGVIVNAFTAKTIPVDADITNIGDSAASFASKAVTLLNLWTNYFKGKANALYMALVAPGTTGNVLTSNGSAWTSAAPSGGGDFAVADGRLTLTSGTPVTTADVTGATTIYYTPYKGNSIGLYDGSSAWTILTFTEKSLALGTLTSGLPYDVFAYNNSGVVALELLAWTSATARATALVYQNGVLVKSGATTRRYLGTFYTTSTTQTADALATRYLYNYYNRVMRVGYVIDNTSHSYVTGTLQNLE